VHLGVGYTIVGGRYGDVAVDLSRYISKIWKSLSRLRYQAAAHARS
jgi:hypothetical protein